MDFSPSKNVISRIFHTPNTAIEQRTKCKSMATTANAVDNDARFNDVNYEFDASTSKTRICDDDDDGGGGGPVNDVTDVANDIKPTATLRPHYDTNSVELSHSESYNLVLSSQRQARSMTHANRDATALHVLSTLTTTPPSQQKPPASLAVAEERGQNPNADIQDIITGIVKLLNGNVNVQNSAPLLPTRRFATRINNRGPPRISDLPPILPNIDEKFPIIHQQQTTPFPTIVRKPAVPYPFDLPDNMHTQLLPPAAPADNYPIKMHGNMPLQKPPSTPPNRPPWHGNRTRQPIVGNPNRLHVPTRPAIQQHPIQPQTTPDYRSTINTQNTMTPFFGKATEKYAASVVTTTTTTAPIDDYVDEKDDSVDHRTETIQMQPESNRTTDDSNESDTIPLDLAVNDDGTATMATATATTTTTTKTTTTIPKIDLNISSDNYQNLNLPRVTSVKDDQTTSSLSTPQFSTLTFDLPYNDPTTIVPVGFTKHLATPELPHIPSIHKLPVPNPTIRYTVNTTTSDIVQTSTYIAPSKVMQTTQPIESTDFKSYYARPGIVLDDTIDFSRKDLHNGPPKTPALGIGAPTNYHHGHAVHGGHDGHNIQSTASLSNIYAEIFDVTLSAIQGPGGGGGHKVVDLIEIENTGGPELRPTRVNPNDIIVTASDDNSFVSIDGKRTYINLFGETAENDHLRKTNLATKSYTDYPHTRPVSFFNFFYYKSLSSRVSLENREFSTWIESN